MIVTQYPRLANVGDLPRLVQDDRVTWQWPPPGTEVRLLGFPELWALVVGDAVGDVGDWYVTTLGNMAGYFPDHLDELLLRQAGSFTGPIAAFAGSVGNWPVIYEVGRNNTMRWVSSVIRGTLGTTEQFQFGLNWGNPGADPDPNEAGAAAFAQTLLDNLGAEWISVTGGASIQSVTSTQVKFTEVGVTVKTQSSGTNADGTGGDLEQKFDTQWASYAVGSQPTGTGGATSLPYEVACAVTLQTDKRGPSGRGRIYLPPFATSAMDVSGLFGSTAAGAAGRFVGRLITSTEADSGYKCIVVSRRRMVLNEVTSVATGVVPDAQRRRRRSQDEARTVQWTRP